MVTFARDNDFYGRVTPRKARRDGDLWSLQLILIVDANREGAEGLCRLLCGHGVRCTYAKSGEEALAFIQTHPTEGPFLIMLDATPSAERAVNAIRGVLNGHNTGDVCVVVHGPPPDAKERDKAMRLGASGWLVKSQGCRDCSGENVDRILRWYSNIGGTLISAAAAGKAGSR